jgi:beta-lactamase class A
MPILISRRAVLSGAFALLIAQPAHATGAAPQPVIATRLAEIEASVRGRLGVAILDTQTGTVYGRRQNERFALCSTFKVLATALVLDRVDHGQEQLGRRVAFNTDDVVPYSPVTEVQAGAEGMTMSELSAAAITQSDNTAANLMLKSFGGPKVLTEYLRSLGDKTTRLDRLEPVLNEVKRGDPRDTTTPRAMVYTLQRILLGNILSTSSKKQLVDWLMANTTGANRLKAGLPKGWRIGDKTGTSNGATNDVAIIWPPNRAPIIIAAYLADAQAPPANRDAALADVARAAAALF